MSNDSPYKGNPCLLKVPYMIRYVETHVEDQDAGDV